MSDYPGGYDLLSDPNPNDPMAVPSHAGVHQAANAGIEAVQQELGLDPAGAYPTVVERLDAGSSDPAFPDTDWQELTLINGWTPYGASADWAAKQYRRIGGVVYVNMMVGAPDATADTACVLPVGFRPGHHTGFSVERYPDVHAHAQVLISGEVQVKGHANAGWIMVNVSFPAEQ